MNRGLAGLLGALGLAGAVASAPPAIEAPGRPLSALGRSLGGLRVLAVDALFLRAEALRRNGRAEELPALYQAIVDLDPDNVAALELLAGELADNLLSSAPTAAGREAWWQEAWGLIQRGLAQHPGSARLAFRAADLLLAVPASHPDLAQAIDQAVGGVSEREARGLAFLVLASRASPHLPRVGRLHLLRLARLAPLLAVRALSRGEPLESAALRLVAAEELAVRHADALLLMEEEVVAPPGTPGEPARLPLALVLARSIEAVRAALLHAQGGAREPALAALAAYREAAGATPLAAELETWLRAH